MSQKNEMRAVALLLLACTVAVFGLTLFLEPVARAADGEGAYTEIKGVSEAYWRDNQTTMLYMGKDGTDSIALVTTDTDTYLMSFLDASSGSATSTRANGRGVRQNVPLSCRFSNAGANATVYIVYFNKVSDSSFFLLGIEGPKTITAGALTVAGPKYLAETQVYDTYGATHCAILVSAISAGTVDIGVGSF